MDQIMENRVAPVIIPVLKGVSADAGEQDPKKEKNER